MSHEALKLFLFRYAATPAQVAALRSLSLAWTAMPQGFWPFDDVLEALARPSSLAWFVAESASSAVWAGVLLIDIGPFAADILYIYVDPAYRRRGLAEILLQGALQELYARPSLEALFLEVRADNTPAIALYEGLGFEKIDVRRGYYRNGDDAVIYRLKWAGES